MLCISIYMKKHSFLIHHLCVNRTRAFVIAFLAGVMLHAQNVYQIVTSIDELSDGDKVLIVNSANDGAALAIGQKNSNNRGSAAVVICNGQIVTNVASNANDTALPYELTLAEHSGGWSFYDAVNDASLIKGGQTKDNNYLKTEKSFSSKQNLFGISIQPTTRATVIQSKYATMYAIFFNSEYDIFSCYQTSNTSSSHISVYLYRYTDAAVGVENVSISKGEHRVNVYSTTGIEVRRNVPTTTATEGLTRGIYIIDGRKITVR